MPNSTRSYGEVINETAVEKRCAICSPSSVATASRKSTRRYSLNAPSCLVVRLLQRSGGELGGHDGWEASKVDEHVIVRGWCPA